MTKDEALRLAWDALERCVATCFDPYAHEQAMSGSEHFVNQTITAIKEALAQTEQEPVAWAKFSAKGNIIDLLNEPDDDYTPLYTTPPQRTWVGLTDEEIRLQWSEFWEAECHPWAIDFAQAIEAKLRSKNETN
jgi:hypothetical protein